MNKKIEKFEKNYINIFSHLRYLSFTFIHNTFIIEIFIYETLDLLSFFEFFYSCSSINKYLLNICD